MSEVDSDVELEESPELDLPASTQEPVRFSRLKLMGRSAKHYLGMTVRQTQSIERGTATHSLVLGGRPVICYPNRRYGKTWDAFKEKNGDAEILTAKDYDKANRMADAVRRHELAMSVLRGDHEVELSWTINGRACAGRIDCIGSDFSTELKTGATSSPERFMWQSLRMGYHAQCSWYRNGIELAGLGKKKDTYVVVVEQEPPHVVTVFTMVPRAIEAGTRMWRLWLEQLLACEAANAWPGYSEALVPLDVPEDDPDLIFEGDEAA